MPREFVNRNKMLLQAVLFKWVSSSRIQYLKTTPTLALFGFSKMQIAFNSLYLKLFKLFFKFDMSLSTPRLSAIPGVSIIFSVTSPNWKWFVNRIVPQLNLYEVKQFNDYIRRINMMLWDPQEKFVYFLLSFSAQQDDYFFKIQFYWRKLFVSFEAL